MFNIIEKLYFKQKNNLALYDKATGLYNRNWFEYIGKKKYIGKIVFITIVDIDEFKKINDRLGHSYGDEVIKELSNKLKNVFNTCDVVHYGGDEFVILANYNPSPMLHIMNNGLYDYQISYGTAMSVEGDVYETFKQADTALYKMKEQKHLER